MRYNSILCRCVLCIGMDFYGVMLSRVINDPQIQCVGHTSSGG